MLQGYEKLVFRKEIRPHEMYLLFSPSNRQVKYKNERATKL